MVTGFWSGDSLRFAAVKDTFGMGRRGAEQILLCMLALLAVTTRISGYLMTIRTEISGSTSEKLPANWYLERIANWAKTDPDKLAFAVDHPDTLEAEEYTYQDVVEQSDRIAAALHANGVLPGDRIGIEMDNSPHWVFVILGVLRIGGVGVPLSVLLPASSIRRLVDHSECRFVFADKSNIETALEACEREKVIGVGSAQGGLAWDEFLKQGEEVDWEQNVSPDGTAVLMYTSGTTGEPKGVRISAAGLSYDIRGLIELLELAPGHRILSVLPFSHVLPLVANGLGSLASGAAVVFLSVISPQAIVDAFKRHQITFFVCVPQFFYAVHKRIFAQVAEQPWVARKVFGLLFGLARRVKNQQLSRKLFSRIHNGVGPSLTLLITGGSRFEPSIARDFQTLGYTMVQAYGLTETTAAATVTPISNNVVGTVGLPLRGVSVQIYHPNEEGIGEVCIAGDILMQGYYLNDVATAEAIRDGWLHTGDLGRLDSDGNLMITGRSKDVIVLSSGKNIYPEEVEEHYEKSAFVKEICVMAMPKTSGPGDTLHAVVIPNLEEFRRRNQTAITEMIRYELDNLSKQLASFMRVHSLRVRNEPLPRTITRKLKRFEIHGEEVRVPETADSAFQTEDHERLREGVGAIVAEAIHAAKPDLAGLHPDMNFELDMGFDSLGRVELLVDIEARLDVEVDESKVSQIFTLEELLQVLGDSSGRESVQRRSWKEKLTADGDDDLAARFIRDSRASLTFFAFPTIRLLGLIAKIPFRTKVRGLEKLPREGPYLICPNHVSYLDPFLICSVLPFRVIRDIFILGYTDYFEGALMNWLGSTVNIVPVDPNSNLNRAMRIAAVGLRRRRILLVFPEGERSIDGNLTAFKKGSAILSIELGVPIVPVRMKGTFEAWPRGGDLRAHPVEILIGDPILPDTFAHAPDPYAAINEALRKAVAGLVR